MSKDKVVGVHILQDEVIGLTANGNDFSMGGPHYGPCCYDNCRAGKMCKEGYCVGATLGAYGYQIENGELVEITRH